MNSNRLPETFESPNVNPKTIQAPNSSTIDTVKNEVPSIFDIQIEQYIIEKLIARGGMGCVYEGRDLTLDRQVAIKTLLPHANAKRFITESKITARLPHPGIPPVKRWGN